MKKFKNIFKYLIMSFALIATGLSGLLMTKGTTQTTDNVASAAFSSHTQISNSLPNYVKVNENSGDEIKEIYLLTSNSAAIDLSIGNQVIEKSGKKNPAYYEETLSSSSDIPATHYYFDFTSSLSLYKDLSNTQVQNGALGENLLKTQNISEYRTVGVDGSEGFSINSGAVFTPKKLNIQFTLNTAGKEIHFEGNKVVLNEEGIYTLVIPALVYYTQNSGASYTLLDQQSTNLYYSFMVFDSTTYFLGAGTQNVDFSSNVQTSTINSSEAYSLYHFYNYAYSDKLEVGSDSTLDEVTKSIPENKKVNTLPYLSYNYKSFKVNIKHTDVDSNARLYHIEYQDGNMVILNETGQVLTNNSSFFVNFSSIENEAKITFTDLGEYEISFEYLYIIEVNGQTISYSLPLKENLSSDQFQNKAQKLYIYGYQAMYSDYGNPNPATNQPSDTELKGLSIDAASSRFTKNADITSEVNTYIKTAGLTDIDGVSSSTNIISNSNSTYEDSTLDTIASYTQQYITTSKRAPVSTNQPPIKFITNTNAKTSKIYSVTEESNGTYTINTTNEKNFEGFNQNTPGTYCYIIQYTYDYYMSTAGTLQKEYNHYQIFFFTITNTIPSVVIYEAEEEDGEYVSFNEIHTRGFTNKDVFILNNTKSNEYDAEVTITLSAYNYNNDSYRFTPQNIKTLTGIDPLLAYQKFVHNFDGDSTTQDVGETDGKEAKYGILIKKTAAYANSRFTITVKSDTTTEASVQTFTIDTQEIQNVTAKNVNKTNSTYYTIAETIQSSKVTNRPIALSWEEKNSQAKTYGYLKHIPFTSVNNYPTNSFSLSTVLGQLLSNSFNMLPVDNQIDFSQISKWGEYSNSLAFSNNIPATNVRSENGIYILQVYDEAGNYTFEVFMIDNTAPIFVQYTKGEFNSYEFVKNSANISIPAAGTEIYIQWAKYKGIYIGDTLSIDPAFNGGYDGYLYSGIKDAKFDKALNEFLNGKTKQVSKLDQKMNGHYFITEISDTIYVKDRSSTYVQQQNSAHSFKINFTKIQNGKEEAHEGTVKIILRDASNNFVFQDKYYEYLNYPSSYVSFNISSDLSQFTIYQIENGKEKNLEGESYSQIFDLYYKNPGTTQDLTTDSAYMANASGFRVKYSYRPATRISNPLFVRYIPVLSDGTTLDFVNVKYYPYETAREYAGDKENESYYYYYKDIAKNPQIELTLFKYDPAVNYSEGQTQENSLAFGADSDKPLAGKYVITRQYKIGDNPTALANTLTKAYDFFTREITFYIDNYGIITSLESVHTTDKDDKTTPVNTGLESIIGGDIVLNMHDNANGGKDVSISFPSYKDDTGLNSGSFFTKNSFDKNDDTEIATVSIETNKLPVALYIPKYKYTISSVKQGISNFDLTVNDSLSYFGDVVVRKNSDNFWEIVLNGQNVLPNLFESEEDAYEYLYDTMSITEYELSAQITWVDPNNKQNKQYYSTQMVSSDKAHYKTTDGEYLAFYERPSGFGGSYGEAPVPPFTKVGTYYVTLFQGANDTKSDIYSVYKLAFEITSAKPEYDVLNYDTKTKLSPVETRTLDDGTEAEIIYTNAKALRVQWEDSTDPYMAKIDKSTIQYGAGNGEAINKVKYIPNSADSDIHQIEGTNSYYFDITAVEGFDDLIQYKNYMDFGLKIEFQFENHGAYYDKAIKLVYFDIEASTDTLNALMETTAKASNNILSVGVQQSEMRQYIDYAGRSFNPTDSENQKASYIYNVNNGAFANYAFVVDKAFFANLQETYFADKKPKDGSTISEIYFNPIDDILTYNQSDKSTFLDSFEILSSVNIDTKFKAAGYYEIVETDWAGNRTIYVVYLKDPNVKELIDQTGKENVAIDYKDSKTADGVREQINDSEINSLDDVNIYANTGFSITELNYNQDPWLYFTIGENYYFKSPRLTQEGQGQVYQISTTNSSFIPVKLSDISNITKSSNQKHILTLANRTAGESKNCYITVMDATLIVETITENVAQNIASISITVPSSEQVASSKTGYIYPVQISSYVYNPEKPKNERWEEFATLKQETYGVWTSVDENNFMDYNYQSSAYLNKLLISAEAGENKRVKFVILDNFGNETTVITLTGNALSEELDTLNSKLYSLEDGEGRTYISAGAIVYKYNPQLYRVKTTPGTEDGTRMTGPEGSTIKTITFQPTYSSPLYNGYYTLEVYDESSYDEMAADNSAAFIKRFYIRLYNQLPTTLLTGEDPSQGIIFLDKDHKNLGDSDLGSSNIKPDTAAKPLYLNVEMNGKTYAGAATTVTTYSRNVTVRFRNGLKLANSSLTSNYNKGITYSAYISNDEGQTWQNIDNTSGQEFTTYIISGVGRYLMLIKYNDEEILTDSFKLYEINILDSAASYYYITVNGQHVEKSSGIKYSDGSTEYEITYIVALEYADRNNLLIHMNEELEVQKKKTAIKYLSQTIHNPIIDPDVPTGTIVTEIYSYWCDEAKGDFVIIYIPQSNNIVGTVSYELPSGETESLKDGLDKLVVADKDTSSTFNKLKISYTSYYGVAQNKVTPIVYKVLNGNPVQINIIPNKTSDTLSYITLEMSGTYYLQLVDSCTPVNSQIFNGKRLNGYEYVEITFLSNAPFEVTTTNADGEEYTTAPIQKAIYNNPITISLTNVASYYLPSAELTIEATKNGAAYSITGVNNSYTFSEPGFYTVKFHATSSTGVLIREEVYSFTIINKNESRYAFEFAEFGNYYIEKVLKDGVDITEDLIKISNFKTIKVGDKDYLSSITLNHLDEKTGSGRYEVTVNLNNAVYSPVMGETFTFALWINLAKPPINVSIPEGGATTDIIYVYFNPQNLYKTVGDCYLQIGSSRYNYTSENIQSAGDSERISVSGSGTHFIQVYTQSGHLLYSYKVIKTEPLNSFAIIAIILGVLALGAIIFITVKLRKRQKVK